ncbi:hypothetical protein CPB86DRAFT_786854 [Serendipita vermifera]|nr:hypothetical protein CPB86DRAFT_786854 [Serendipita vermifera]
MQVLTIISLVYLVLFQASLVRADTEALGGRGGVLVDLPTMRRTKVRSIVPRTLLQVGSRLNKRQCGVVCSDGGCCPYGTYCDEIQGVLGCCAIGHTCSEFP